MNAVKIGLLTVFAFTCATAPHALGQTSSPASNKSSGNQVVQASGANAPSGQVRQVADTQTQAGGRGILNSLFGSRQGGTSAKPQATSTSSTSRSRSGLFGGGSDASDDDGRRVIEPVIPTEEPDWSGVPYHRASPATAATNKSPLSDPNDPSNRNASLPRGNSAPTAPDVPRIASRDTSNSATGRAIATPRASQVPVPPSEAEVAGRARATTTSTSGSSTSAPAVELNTSTYQPPSSTESSRRSRRREVQPLEVAADQLPAPAPEANTSSRRPTSGTTTSEPKVARRTLPTTEPSSPSDQYVPQPAAPAVANNSGSSRRVAANPPAPATTPSVPSLEGSTVESERAIQEPPRSATVDWRPARNDETALPPEPAGRPAVTEQMDLSHVVTQNSTPSVSRTTPPAPPKASVSPATQPATSSAPAVTTHPTQDIAATTPNDRPATATSEVDADWSAVPTVPMSEAETMTPLLNGSDNSAELAAVDDRPLTLPPANETPNPRDTVAAPQSPAITPNSAAAPNADLGVTPHEQHDLVQGGIVNAPSGSSSAVNMRSEIPGIRVITTGPADIPVRQTSVYEIVVENAGVIDAPGAAIQVKLPNWIEVRNLIPSRGEIARQNDANGRQLLWVVEGLPRNGSERLRLQLAATQAKEFDVDVEWAVIPSSNTARVTVREPKLELAIEGPDQVIYGHSQTYIVRVKNPGNGVAENVVFTLSPNSATPQSQRFGAIAPGKEAVSEVELTARDLESLQIHGLATADLELRQEQMKTIEVIAARLHAELSGPPLKYQDAMAEYTLQLSNDGSAACENAVAVIELPPGVTYRGGLNGASVEGNFIRWKIASIGAGETANFTFQCQMQRTGEHRIAFNCQGSAAGATNVAFTTNVEALADLVLTINDPVAPAPVGDEVTYEIVIFNRGSKAAANVTALAQFGPDIEPARVEGTEATIEPGQVKFDAIAKIDAGQTVRLKVVAKAEKEGHHRFRAEVQCGDTLLIAEEATRYMELAGQRVSRRSDEANR